MTLYAVRTVNLSILATAFSCRAKEESNYKQLQRFLRLFEMPYAQLAEFVVKLLGGAHNIERLLGDRELAGKKCFAWLRHRKIKFRMRLKKDTQVRNGRGKFVPAWRLFAQIRIDQMLVIPEARRMWGMDLFISGCRLKDGEWLILVSSDYVPEPSEEFKTRTTIRENPLCWPCLKTARKKLTSLF